MREPKPPYIPFNTFLSIVDDFAQDGIPEIINFNALKDRYGKHPAQQMSAACRFLGLTDGSGKPTESLNEFVYFKDRRPELLKYLMGDSFSELFEYPLNQLENERFVELLTRIYNVEGETRKRVKAFFTRACQFADINLSKSILSRAWRLSEDMVEETAENNGTPLLNGSESASNMNHDTPVNGSDIATAYKSKAAPSDNRNAFVHTINLKSGGTLVLSAEVDVWKLEKNDRNFVFKIVDDMREYEQAEV